MGKRWVVALVWIAALGCGSGRKAPGIDGATFPEVPVAAAADADGQVVPDGARDTLPTEADGSVFSATDGSITLDSATDAFDPLGACAGSYVACGCGCCGPSPGSGATPRCYYPTEGDRLSSIMSEDLAIRGGPSCATVGCTLGTWYQCCVPAGAATPADYSVESYIGGYDRLMIERVGFDGQCANLLLESPAREPNPAFRVSAPPLFRMAGGGLGACGAASRSPAMGGVGTVALRKNGAGCVLDVAVWLFLPSTSGPASRVRFEATGLDVPMFGSSACPD